MKIILINNLYKPHDRGGAEKYVENLVDNFLKKKINVSVISTKPFFAKKVERENLYYLNSFYFYLSKFPSFLKLFWHLFNIFNIFKFFQIRKILKIENPDIVITNNLLGLGFLIPKLLYKKKIKHLHVLHDVQLLHPSGLIFLGKENILDSIFAKIYQKINSYLFLNVSHLVAPSDWIINLHLNRNFFKKAKKIKVFNPIESRNFLKKQENREVSNFIYVGQLEKHKGIEELLEVFSKIEPSKKTSLAVVGAGTLEEKIRKKYINKNIIFLGRLDRDRVFKKIMESDCLLFPSLCYENSPSVIYEAALSGIDFIYSNIGGASEIGDYFGGVPFNPMNFDELKEKIILYKNKKESQDKNEKILNLSTDVYVNKLINFLEINRKHFLD